MPAEMIAVPAVVSAGSLIGRALAVQPKRYDTAWREYPNLWGLVVAPPGSMKSVGFSIGTAHVAKIAHSELERHEAGRLEREAAIQTLDLEIAHARRAASGKDGTLGDLDAFAAELVRLESKRESLSKPARRLMTQDPTVEKLGELLCENPRGMLLCRDELSGWIETLGKAGREGTLAFFLEAWAGKVAHSVDRIGRGAIHVPPACVSVLGTIQPAKLAAIVGATAKEGGDGLLQRFSMSVWPDFSRSWRNVDRAPDVDAEDRARRAFEALDGLDASHLEAGENETPRLGFAPDAQELFDGWLALLEHSLRAEVLANSPALEGHLSKYRKLMPALALIFHVLDAVDGGWSLDAIGVDSARRAASWCEYLEQHARRIYGSYDPATLASRALAERIEGGFVVDGQTVREVYQPGWSHLSTPDAVQAGCRILSELGWLRIEEVKRGGRPSAIIRLHPDIVDQQRSRHG